MSPSTVHDLAGHRSQSTARQRDAGSLWTYEPLPPNREKRPPAQPAKKRRRPTPPTPAFNFNPRDRLIPNGKNDPSVSPEPPSKSAVPENPTSLYDEPYTASPAHHEVHAEYHDEYDVEWSHVFSSHPAGHPIPSNLDTSYADMGSVAPDSYDSPASHTSSSSPALSDQSPRTVDFPATGIDYAPQPPSSMPLCPYDGQGYVMAHQALYGFSPDSCPDHPVQGCPVFYVDPSRGRAGLHDGSYLGNNGYQYPNSRRS